MEARVSHRVPGTILSPCRRMCHSGVPDISQVDKVIAVLEKILNRTIDWKTTEVRFFCIHSQGLSTNVRL